MSKSMEVAALIEAHSLARMMTAHNLRSAQQAPLAFGHVHVPEFGRNQGLVQTHGLLDDLSDQYVAESEARGHWGGEREAPFNPKTLEAWRQRIRDHHASLDWAIAQSLAENDATGAGKRWEWYEEAKIAEQLAWENLAAQLRTAADMAAVAKYVLLYTFGESGPLSPDASAGPEAALMFDAWRALLAIAKVGGG